MVPHRGRPPVSLIETHKVQTALLLSPDSMEPIAMAFERADVDALLLRELYQHLGFYCGEWLGLRAVLQRAATQDRGSPSKHASNMCSPTTV